MMLCFLRSAGLAVALLVFGWAAPVWAGEIEAGEAWARARMPEARAGAAYVTLTNRGGGADTLLSAASPVAETVELHTHIMDGNIMQMRQVENIPLPAGETVTLQPGGLHVMLIGLKEPLTEGKAFPVTFSFEKAPPMTLKVTVKGMAAGSPGGGMPSHGGAHGTHN